MFNKIPSFPRIVSLRKKQEREKFSLRPASQHSVIDSPNQTPTNDNFFFMAGKLETPLKTKTRLLSFVVFRCLPSCFYFLYGAEKKAKRRSKHRSLNLRVGGNKRPFSGGFGRAQPSYIVCRRRPPSDLCPIAYTSEISVKAE